ncbi:MAG: LacI family DNA-binding transcriptional regulator [Tissierellaceae bacterium]|nr:LacI family DNA-binding transcriptional regulator [Tissierellaceae bacterium]
MTIKKIAKLANVSSATVSKVINGKDKYISEATRKRVLEIVEREGYVPNAVAKSLKVKRTKTLGIVIPDVMNLFFSELARGVEDAAEKMGYSIILCNSDNKVSKEEKYIQILQEKMVDGIILAASESSVSKYFNKRGTPMVLLDRDLSVDDQVGKITVDNESGIYEATCFLINKGCRDIGYISSEISSKISFQRLSGYKKALLDRGFQVSESMIYLNNYTIETGYYGMLELLKNNIRVDGVCCGNDMIAIGAIKALNEKGINIPTDVKIIGFDDIYITQYTEPPITTMAQPIYKMGEEAVKMILSIIEGKETELAKVFDTKLIERGTT